MMTGIPIENNLWTAYLLTIFLWWPALLSTMCFTDGCLTGHSSFYPLSFPGAGPARVFSVKSWAPAALPLAGRYPCPGRRPARLLYSIGSCTGNKRHRSGRRGYQVLRDIRAGLWPFRHGAGLSDCRCYRNACDLSSQAALSNWAAPCYPVPAISRLWLLYSDPGPTIFKIGDNAYETE